MDYKQYQRKLNDVIEKCPIEAGVEILVYSLLDSIIDNECYSLVDINRICRENEKRLVLNNVVPDIAVLSKDFKWGDKTKGNAYGFVEVKATGISLRNTEQIKKEKTGTKHLLLTNGIRWIYYLDGEVRVDCSVVKDKRKCSIEKVEIDKNEFNKLIEVLADIQWD